MNTMEAVPVLVGMACTFFAAFTAVALWSGTRDAAWMLVVLGAVFFFIDSLYSTLVLIGLATWDVLFLKGFPMLESVLTGLPPLLLTAGFLVFIIRNRRY
jgi:hypothetical protein